MIPRAESGVKAYITGAAAVTASFPVDFKGNASIDCAHCQFFRSSSRRCGLNNQIPEYPEKYIGSQCPLVFEEDEAIE